MKRISFLLALLAWGVGLQAQFVPAPTSPVDTTALFEELSQRIEVVPANIPEEYREKYAEINEERFRDLQDGIRDSSFLFHPDLQVFLDDLMEDIIEANNLEVDPLVLIRRSQSPNASSYGNGIFTVNLGLFQDLKTQDRIAFVLCHEMAHNELKHQLESMLEYCQRDIKIESVKKQLSRRRVKKGKRESLVSGARQSVYSSFRLKRRNELAADSLGLEYYSALDFSNSAVASALDTLGNRDLLNLQDIDFVRLLQTEGYPVKEKWLEAPPEMFGGSFGSGERPKGFWQRDSVATHPEMEARLTGLAVLIPQLEEKDEVPEKPHSFDLLVDREMIRAQTEGGVPGLAIINGLKLLAANPDSQTAQALFGEALLATYQSIEKHDFDEAVPPEAYFRDPNARFAIRMFHQMRKSELRKLTLAWIKERAPVTGAEEMEKLFQKTTTYFSGLE